MGFIFYIYCSCRLLNLVLYNMKKEVIEWDRFLFKVVCLDILCISILDVVNLIVEVVRF